MKLKNMRIPISAKIIGVTTFIILTAMVLVTKQSSEFFRKVMTQREEFSNFTEASLRGKQVETILDGSLDKARNLSQILLKETFEGLGQYKLPKDKNLVGIEIYQVVEGKPQLYVKKVQEDFLIKNKLTPDFVDQVRQKKPFPISSVMQKNIELQFAEVNPSVRVVSIGFPYSRDAQNQVNTFVIAAFNSEMIQSLFSNDSEREFFLIDRNGFLLAHQNEELLRQGKNIKGENFVQKALADATNSKQLTFKNEKGKAYIGAFVKSSFWGTVLLAQTPLSIVNEPAQEVQRKAIFISGIVLSFALFAVFLFSLTLSKPIEVLAELIKEIPKGNFNISARKKVKSHDEVGDLAAAFDHMTEGLKERDKVKNLFNKFHGSSVTENLLQQEVSVGGTRKEVTVFFSDIRGFTKFSEGHTPEEVVSMLNEYFAVMVGIINRHGGVVDKFIGDAIMAVWGVPAGSDKDTENALKACLEMRSSLFTLNASRRERGLTEIQIGMGLHAGAAISGTIGSEERMEFTVIGDTVNVTSRIESSTKHFEVDLLVSDEVFNRLSQPITTQEVTADGSVAVAQTESQFKFDLAGDIEVKGKTLPLRLYKVLS
ncbi:adenylate/guanylate cyclase domain-containing protein [Pseudobdellovibrio sp. HCB154]|uniref:adenylate/guanylate cyclase domain-containing protein n=1 Tax=Pseudobdellovibrio sp. HCB154 TaxID=3386277 RepID=UPI003917014C